MTRKQAKLCAVLAREHLQFACANRRNDHDPSEHMRISLGYRAASQNPSLFDLDPLPGGFGWRLVLAGVAS